MRLKNVKGAKEIIEKSSYVLKNPNDYKGRFSDLFGNDNPIYIEIGMGKGDFIINNALLFPNINFIGIEKFDSVLVRAVQKLEDKKIDNLKLIRFDAVMIEELFEHEIDLIYLNFSDPWPKEKHRKRRLTSKEFLLRYDDIFKNEKRIIMKTDNRKLFEYSILSLTEYGYKIEKISLDLYNDEHVDNVPTEYETRFHNLGFPIYKMELKK